MRPPVRLTPPRKICHSHLCVSQRLEAENGSKEAVTFQVVCEDQYTVTVKYVMDDAEQTEIQTSYVSEEMSKESPYDVSGQIPDSITYKGQSYAKDTVKGVTSGTLTGNVEITAVYTWMKSAARMAAARCPGQGTRRK